MNSTDKSISFKSTSGLASFNSSTRFCTAAATSDVARTLRSPNADGDDRLSIEPGESAPFGDRIGDHAEITEAHLAAHRQADHRSGQIVDGFAAGQRTDRFVPATDLRSATRNIGKRAAQAVTDINRGQAYRCQAVGIERNQNFPIDAAYTLDLRHAAHALQRTDHHVVDVPGKLLRRLPWRYRRVCDDRQADHIDPLDQRLVDILR